MLHATGHASMARGRGFQMMTRGKGVIDAENLMMTYLIRRAHEAAHSRRQKILTYLNYAYA